MELATPALSFDEVLEVVERLGGLPGILHEATDDERAPLYASMGVSAVYSGEPRGPTGDGSRCFKGVSEGGLEA
jgi:hypothetical protein